MGIKAIIFDLDNTLYAEKDYIELVAKEIARLLVGRTYYTEEAISNKFINIFEKTGDKNIFQNLLNELELDYDGISELIECYRNVKGDIKLYSDAQDILDFKGKYKLGIITNGGVYTQNNKIKLLNIQEKFDSIVITGEKFLKHEWKPHYKPYKYITDELQVSVEECLFVGDRIETDILGALGVGMKAILVDRSKKVGIQKIQCRSKMYYMVNSLSKITQILEE